MTELAVKSAQDTPPAVDTPKPETPPPAEKAEEGAKVDPKPEINSKPIVPEKYDLKLPEGSLLRAQDLEKIASLAKERGLSNEDAQKLVVTKDETYRELLSKQQEELKQKTQTEWINEGKNDKEIGGDAFQKNVEMAKRVVQKFGSESFQKTLSETGLGNHPELVRTFARIGKLMSEDQLVIGATGAVKTKKSAEEVLYGGGKKE